MNECSTIGEDLVTIDGIQIVSGLESFQTEGLDSPVSTAQRGAPTITPQQTGEASERTDLLGITCWRQAGFFAPSKYDPVDGREGGKCCHIQFDRRAEPQWMTLTEFARRASGDELRDWKGSITVNTGSGRPTKLSTHLGLPAEGTLCSQLLQRALRAPGGIIPCAEPFESFETLDHSSHEVVLGARISARWGMVDGSYKWFPGTVINKRRRGEHIQHQIRYDDDGQRQW